MEPSELPDHQRVRRHKFLFKDYFIRSIRNINVKSPPKKDIQRLKNIEHNQKKPSPEIPPQTPILSTDKLE
jgi:hypothetical protein